MNPENRVWVCATKDFVVFVSIYVELSERIALSIQYRNFRDGYNVNVETELTFDFVVNEYLVIHQSNKPMLTNKNRNIALSCDSY